MGTVSPFRAAGALVLAAGVSGCGADEAPVARDSAANAPAYMGIETQLLDSDLVRYLVKMQRANNADDLTFYANCAAARYTLIRGYGFARHVRTNVTEEAGIWRADAVYTISPVLPRGVNQIDAEVTVAECARKGIPTV